jgi:hypothetical protein
MIGNLGPSQGAKSLVNPLLSVLLEILPRFHSKYDVETMGEQNELPLHVSKNVRFLRRRQRQFVDTYCSIP